MNPYRTVPAGLLLAFLTLGRAAPAAAEIYRCQGTDGSLVFSDLPCADDAEIHHSTGGLSVIAAADSLEDAAAANRAFIEQRRTELLEQRRAARQREQRQDLPKRVESSDSGLIPRRLTRHELNRIRAARREAELRRRERAAQRDEPEPERRTLLSRSGGAGKRILD